MLADYKARLVEGPVLLLPRLSANYQFNPQTLIPLDRGTGACRPPPASRAVRPRPAILVRTRHQRRLDGGVLSMAQERGAALSLAEDGSIVIRQPLDEPLRRNLRGWTSARRWW